MEIKVSEMFKRFAIGCGVVAGVLIVLWIFVPWTRMAIEIIMMAVANLAFIRYQERKPRNFKRYLPVIFAIDGFALIYVGTRISELFFLVGIGAWIVIASLFFEFYRLRKEMKKEGKEIIL